MDDNGLPLPAARCLSKEQAAAYLGIGVTLLTELNVPALKLGRRCVYDRAIAYAGVVNLEKRLFTDNGL